MGYPRRWRGSLTSLVIMVASAHCGWGQEIMLAASQDNTLYEDDQGSLSNGAGEYLFSGRSAQAVGSIRRGVIQFDVAAAIPAGALITAAELTLHVSRAAFNFTPSDMGLHRVLQAWGEGDSNSLVSGGGIGAPPSEGDATWLHSAYPATLWRDGGGLPVQGGYFNRVALATQAVGDIGFYSWSSAEFTSAIQDMLDNPASNHGFLVLGDESIAMTAKRFDSRENFDPAARPRLRIEFSPASLICDLNGDTRCDLDDIDLLVSQGDLTVGVPPSEPQFDLTGDGVVDQADIDAWLAAAGSLQLPSGGSFLRGDANLDGSVDASDFNFWNSNKFTVGTVWSQGDFNGSGATDASDFNIWNANKFQSAAQTRPVPEPTLPWYLLLAAGARAPRFDRRS